MIEGAHAQVRIAVATVAAYQPFVELQLPKRITEDGNDMRNITVRFLLVLSAIWSTATWADSTTPWYSVSLPLQAWATVINVPTSRFAVLKSFNNEAVLDRETQLVWQREPLPNPTDFPYTPYVCTFATTGYRMGWRLPTVEELTSLLVAVEIQSAPGAHDRRGHLPDGHPFINVKGFGHDYWTATATTQNGAPARFVVQMLELGVSTVATETDFNALNHPIWCVRGPGGSTDEQTNPPATP